MSQKTWTIERCEVNGNHEQVPNSHFCRCTHVMYDSEKPNAARMPASDSMTEEERQIRDAYTTLSQIYGLNINQSLAGAVFDLRQRIRRLREALDAVVRCSIDAEEEECRICEADSDHRHTEDCPVLAAEKVLNEVFCNART